MTDYFSNYLFTSNETTSVCPVWYAANYSFKCHPPNGCATDPSSSKQYCCDAGTDAVCWTVPSVCASDGSTLTCSSDGYSWCCLENKEICTQLTGQINICWATAHDTLSNITSSALNGSYSSLSSAQPSASSYTFDPLALIALTQTSSTPTTSTQTTSTQTTPTQTTTTTTSSPSPSPNPNPSSTSLSAGAIAGIVIGALAVIAIACIAFLLVRRNRRRKQTHQPAQTSMIPSDYKYKPQPQEIPGDHSHMLPQEVYGDSRYMPHEMLADTRPPLAELPGNVR